MNAHLAPRHPSRSFVIGLVALAMLGSGGTGYVAGQATAAVRTELSQTSAAQIVTTVDGPVSVRTGEHQGSSENPDATQIVPCAGPVCWEK